MQSPGDQFKWLSVYNINTSLAAGFVVFTCVVNGLFVYFSSGEQKCNNTVDQIGTTIFIRVIITMVMAISQSKKTVANRSSPTT